MLPPFVPFAQAFAAVTTAALTGSLYYVAASPKGVHSSEYWHVSSFPPLPHNKFFCLSNLAPSYPDPTYVVAPVLQSRSGRQDLKKLFAG